MRVIIRAFGEARARLGPQGTCELDVPEGARAADVLERVNLPPGLLGIMLLNGQFAADDTVLHEGDLLELVGAVSGG